MTDFIRQIIDQHLADGRYDRVVTRFPPEPNGYLHIGHAWAVWLSAEIAREYDGEFHLRFDDTNPLTEDEAYTRAIQDDVRWLGYDFGEHLYFASDYFDRFYELAERLIEQGDAYVDSQSEEEIRERRGSVTEAGEDSPYRERSAGESLDLFRRMRAGEFEEGAHVLRARIDMAHPNMVMRDPVLYRILHASHYRTGDAWPIYPLYDYAHCLEDAFEDVTHSLCSHEFDNNREIYDWLLDRLGFEEPRPHQYEFGRLNVEHTVLSKRLMIRLVEEGRVEGWDDPRMPTIAALRRRGVPPEALRRFSEMAGVSKTPKRVDVGKLEYAVRDELNDRAPRVMGVLRPLKLVLENVEEGHEETLEGSLWPRDVDREGTRPLPFGRDLWVERTDVSLDPPKGWKRLAPGRSVRLRHAWVVTVESIETDADGEPVEVRARLHPDSLGRNPDGVKVDGVIHWVAAARAVPVEVRLVDRLFDVEAPEVRAAEEGRDITDYLNASSLEVLEDAVVEPWVLEQPADTRFQFERTGYFWRDPGPREGGGEGVRGSEDRPVFTRIVTLRDTWTNRRDRERDRAEEEARGTVETFGGVTGGPRSSGGATGRTDGGGAEPEGPEARVSDARRAARAEDADLQARYRRYQDELGLSLDDADVLTGSRALSDLFEDALEVHPDADAVAAWVVNEVAREVKERPVRDLPFDGAAVGRLVRLVAEDRVSRVAAKDVFAEMVESGAEPGAIVRERGLEKVGDPGVLEPLVDRLLQAFPEKVVAYREGRTGLLGFFVGQAMKETGGSADPKRVKGLLEEKLNAGEAK